MSVNYVFRPIETWPRKMATARKRSPFTVTLGRTYALFERELRHLGVNGDVVIQVALKESEIRLDGRPRSNANRPSHPGVIVSFTAKIGGKPTPLRYVCDSCQDWEDNLRAIVLTLEHLRGADRYGVTTSGEQYVGWNALPPAKPIVTPSMTVEEAAQWMAGPVSGCVPADLLASPDNVRRAYRSRAATLHPDVNGGNERPEWHHLQAAKAVLDSHHGV